MSKIYIGFSYPKKFNLISFMIKSWMRQDYSHAYLRFESDKIPNSVYHAAGGMVHFRAQNKFEEKNHIIKEYEIEVTQNDRLKVLSECIELSGEVYGYLELIKIIFTDIFYTIFNKQLYIKDSAGYICSELVGKILIDKLNLKFNKPSNLLKPNDLDLKLKESNQIRRI